MILLMTCQQTFVSFHACVVTTFTLLQPVILQHRNKHCDSVVIVK